MPLQILEVIAEGVELCVDENGVEVAVKHETVESAMRALTGFTAAYMAGCENDLAPFTLHGGRPIPCQSEWTPIEIGNGAKIVPGTPGDKLAVVPNVRRLCFKHCTLDVTLVPDFVRPLVPYADQLRLVTDHGFCGTRLIRGRSPATRRSLQTIVDAVARMAKSKVFPTDLKLANVVHFWKIPSREVPVDTVLFIDYDQFATSCDAHYRSCSFFRDLALQQQRRPRVFRKALRDQDILDSLEDARRTLEGESPQCTAMLGMHRLMRAIIALLRLELSTKEHTVEVKTPPELYVAEKDEVYWKCYIGGSPTWHD
jgi:hypothetical protein